MVYFLSTHVIIFVYFVWHNMFTARVIETNQPWLIQTQHTEIQQFNTSQPDTIFEIC